MVILLEDEHGPPDPRPTTEVIFHKLAMQYYVNARFAAKVYLMPVSGNLFHHAVEMLLKSHLSHKLFLPELKDRFGHNLKKLWERFKKSFPADDLKSLDTLVWELHRFDHIRYPDGALQGGVLATISWEDVPVKLTAGKHHAEPYVLIVPVLDKFIARIGRLFSSSQALSSNVRHDHLAWEMLLERNPERAFWTGQAS
jgi:hypothetical protein